MFKKNIFLIFFCILLFSCGVDKVLKPSIEQPTSGMIRNLHINNNRLSFNTEDSTYVYIQYKNRVDNNDKYKAWSAGAPMTNHQYSLPVSNPLIQYQMQLSVYHKEKFQDTLFTFTTTYAEHNFLKVHFIDVEQGDAILIQTPDGKNLQIDGGYGTQGSSDWQGGGEPLALNYLLENNISHLDYIIETHRHRDHWGGLSDIVNSNITYDYYVSPTNNYAYQSGSVLNLESSVDFVFYNIGYPPTYSGSNLNNTSIILRASFGDAEFLFMGDAEGEVQDWLYVQAYDLSVDVLKVSHHGSASNNTSNSTFLSQVLNQFAKVAILSYGTNNPYGHPHSIPRFSRFQTYGTNPVASVPPGDNYNFDCGTIVVLTDGKMIFVTTRK